MHQIEEKKEDNSFKGRIIAVFDVKNDPIIKFFKEKLKKDEEPQKGQWIYTS